MITQERKSRGNGSASSAIPIRIRPAWIPSAVTGSVIDKKAEVK